MRLAPIALVGLACAATAAGCGSLGDGVDGTMRPLADAVDSAGATGRPLRLAEVTDFSWDRVHFFAAYTGAAAIEKELGFEWRDAEDSAIDERDAMTLIVFVDDGRVARAFDQDFSGGDFTCLTARVTRRRGLTRREAVLRVNPAQAVDVVTRAGTTRGAPCA